MVDALYGLIGGDAGALNEFSGRDRVTRDDELSVLAFSKVGCGWCCGQAGGWTASLDEACRAHVKIGEPIPPTPRFLNQAVRLSDVLNVRRYHDLGIYVDVGRVCCEEDSIRLWFTVPGDAVLRRITFTSAQSWRFGEDDVLALTLLLPHLRQL